MINDYDVSHAIQLLPGEDLKTSLQQFVTNKGIKAGWILTCVGSLNDL